MPRSSSLRSTLEMIAIATLVGLGCAVGEDPDRTGSSTPWGVEGEASTATPGNDESDGDSGSATEGGSSTTLADPWDTAGPSTATTMPTPGCEGECVELCMSGNDDDGDGVADCDDPDCADHLACSCDLLPDEGFGVHVMCSDPVPWVMARDACEASDMRLVVVDGEPHDTWLVSRSQPRVEGSWWLGLSDLEAEGQWVWSDGAPLGYAHWYPGEPNNGISAPEHCVAFPEHDAYSWNDLECASLRPFICAP